MCHKDWDGAEGSVGSQQRSPGAGSAWAAIHLAGCPVVARTVDVLLLQTCFLLALEWMLLDLSHISHCVQHSLQ